MTEFQSTAEADPPAPAWRPLSSWQRRVLGVLVEKAKTTPDAYPLTLNALTNGCNQKSNRSPQMELSTDDVEQTMEELKQMGAASEIQGGGRVSKYRHLLYDWLGVDKVELAVMAELMLRGQQTIGELRGRAARMEPIDGLAALQPLIQSLIQKNLLLELTPAGRGQIVSHNLYRPAELERITASVATGPPPTAPRSASPRTPPSTSGDDIADLRRELESLRQRVERLEQQQNRAD